MDHKNNLWLLGSIVTWCKDTDDAHVELVTNVRYHPYTGPVSVPWNVNIFAPVESFTRFLDGTAEPGERIELSDRGQACDWLKSYHWLAKHPFGPFTMKAAV